MTDAHIRLGQACIRLHHVASAVQTGRTRGSSASHSRAFGQSGNMMSLEPVLWPWFPAGGGEGSRGEVPTFGLWFSLPQSNSS